jgi:hypothetical protein
MQARADHVLSSLEAMADLALGEHLRPTLRVARALGLRGKSEREQHRSGPQDPRRLHHAFLRFCEASAHAGIE